MRARANFMRARTLTPARVRFPEIGELPYLLTLGGYGFYWIRLPQPEGGDADDE